MAVDRRIIPGTPRCGDRTWNDIREELQDFLEALQQSSDDGIPAGVTEETPTQIQAGVSADTGDSTTGWTPGDHVHDIETDAATGLANANAEGSGTALARADHTHKRDVRVYVDDVEIATRNRINFISGIGVDVTGNDDAGNDEIEITLDSNDSEIDHGSLAGLTDDDHTQYALTDCTLQLTPVVAMPQDGYTAGVANMYFAAGYAIHGRTSLTNNRGLWLWFSLPSQFVADDAVFSLFWVNHVGAAVANCDYNIRIFELVDGQALTLTHNVSGTWAGTGVAGQLNRETYTFDLSAHAAGEGLLIMVRLEDALNANEVYSAAHALKIVADLRQ